jgi:cell division inhibitor SepF
VWWRKAMHMLGLDEQAEYDELQQAQAAARPDADRPSAERGPATGPTSSVSTGSVHVTPADEPSGLGAVRPIRAEASGSTPSVRTGTVRPVPMAANAKPHTVTPTSFNQAQNVADAYKNQQPVIMDLQDADRDLARRLIDFASGLCYGLGGQMERLDHQVYLLTPANVTVSSEERRRLRERGYDA